jgi:peroxiredoxin
MFATLVGIGLILQALTLVTAAVFLYQLLRSQGRLLVRLDALERGSAGLVNIETSASGPKGPKGVDVGTVVESTELTPFRGKKVLLFYWSPDCGFCEMAGEKLVPLQDALRKNNTELLLAAYGSAEANRRLTDELGLRANVLLLEKSPAKKYFESSPFETCGTPSAYLLDEQGRVVAPLAVGMDPVVTLAREAANLEVEKLRLRPLSESRIEREGLSAGVTAPSFNLPTVNGDTVSLDQYRGRKVLLVFSDPQCGPCDELAPHLVRLHAKHGNNGMAVVMVGRGDAEQNRKKAEKFGITFPVGLQERWKLSREYGIFATPVAFLIGKDGVILKDVAQGADEILKLAQEGLARA